MCPAFRIRFALELGVLRPATSLPLASFPDLRESCLSESIVCLPRFACIVSKSNLPDASLSSASPWGVLTTIRLLPFSVSVWEPLAGPGRSAICAPYPPSQPGRSGRPLVLLCCARAFSSSLHVRASRPLGALGGTNPLPTTRDHASSRCSLSAIFGGKYKIMRTSCLLHRRRENAV